MGNKITKMVSQKMQDVASFFKGDKRSAIQEITDIAVTDEMLASYARRYAYGIRNDRRYHESLDAHELLGTLDRYSESEQFYQYREPTETEICERTYARYCEIVDRRLPVYMFLDELQRSRDVQKIAFHKMSNTPVTRKRHFCFAKGGVRYTCDIESSFSVVDGGENTCEITVSGGGDEVKRSFPMQSFLDDPSTILEFAEFLYGQEDNWRKRDQVKQKIGSFSFNGIYGKLEALLKSAMKELEVREFRMMLGEEEKVINIYNAAKREVNAEREKGTRRQRIQEFQESISAKVPDVVAGDSSQETGRAHTDKEIEL